MKMQILKKLSCEWLGAGWTLGVVWLLSDVLGLGVAQNYSIDWYKISGGGGLSTGGVYSVSGTIGQHDAGGAMTGGDFSLSGGFWSLFAVQTPGAPFLTIARSGSGVKVSWPYPSAGWSLQQNPGLTTTNWSVSSGVTNDGRNNFLIVSPPTGNRFYRLKSP